MLELSAPVISDCGTKSRYWFNFGNVLDEKFLRLKYPFVLSLFGIFYLNVGCLFIFVFNRFAMQTKNNIANGFMQYLCLIVEKKF